MSRLTAICCFVSLLHVGAWSCQGDGGSDNGDAPDQPRVATPHQQVAASQARQMSANTFSVSVDFATEGLSLAETVTDFIVSTRGCLSGWYANATSVLPNLTLVAGDVSCRAVLESFTVNDSKVFDIQNIQAFQSEVGQVNVYETSGGEIRTVTNMEQLSDFLVAGSETIRFQVNEQRGNPFSINGPSLTQVSISATPVEVIESIENPAATFLVTRGGDVASPLTIPLAISGDATSGVDFDALPTEVVFAADETSQMITVNLINDGDVEAIEAIVATLAPGAGYDLTQPDAFINILDDDSVVPTTGQVLWFRAADVVPPETAITTWADRTSFNHNASQGNGSLQASGVADGIGGQPAVSFDGVNDYYAISNSSEINLANFSQKTLVAVFKTGSDVTSRQVIYKQGGGTNGINLYLDDGYAYVNIYALSRSWGPVPLRTTVTPDTGYLLRFEFDQGADSVELYSNGVLVDSGNNVGELSSHSGSIHFGGAQNSIKFHDGVNSSGHYFGGLVGELVSYNTVLDAAEVTSLETSLKVRYGFTKPVVTVVANDATAAEGPAGSEDPGEFTISRDFTATSLTVSYVMSGSASSGADFVALPGYVQFVQGQSEVTIPVTTLDDSEEEGMENLTLTIISDPSFQIGQNAATIDIIDDDLFELPITPEFWFDADQGLSLVAGNEVSSWADAQGNHTASATSTTDRPLAVTYDGFAFVEFDGSNDRLNLPDSAQINTAVHAHKTFFLKFRTAGLTSPLQMIFEEGGGSNGINAYLVNDTLYMCIWAGNFTECFNSTVVEDTTYVAYFSFDGGSEVSGYLDGVELGTRAISQGSLPAHSGDNGFGYVNGRTKLHDNSKPSTGSYFSGSIRHMLYFNDVLSGTERVLIENFLLAE